MKHLLYKKSHADCSDLEDEIEAPDKETALKIFRTRHGDWIELKDIISDDKIAEDMEHWETENHLKKCKKCREFARKLK